MNSEAIKRFEILNHNIPKDNPLYGIPFPGQYVVDEYGVVQSKYFEPNHRERVTMQTVLIRSTDWKAKSFNKIETNEFILQYTGNQTTVRPGNHITLVLEIHPKKNMNIYAPEVKGYTPIQWQINQADLYRGGPVEYSKADVLYLEVINEKVPVYREPFRILQEVEIAQRNILNESLGDINKLPELVIQGTLRYQACDNKTCYIPKTIEMKFAFNVERHDWTLIK